MMAVKGAVTVRARPVATALASAWRPWLAVHGIVAASLLLAGLVKGGLPQAGVVGGASGLLAWDGGWYRAIADDGYQGAGPEAVRFFPLLPLTARALAVVGIGEATALVVLASACALGYLAAVSALGDCLLPGRGPAGGGAGRRVAWVAALAPGAAVLALPYAESLAGLVTCLVLLAMHRQVPGWAGLVAGLAAGLVRPTGVLLAAPVLLRALLRRTDRGRTVLLAAGPVAGTALFLVWAQRALGDESAPYSAQGSEGLRGGLLVNPVPGVLDGGAGGLGPVVTLLVALVGVGLVVEVFRRLPVELGLWSAGLFVLAVSSTQAHSLPRYLAGIVPLLLVVPGLLRTERAWRAFLVVAPLLSVALTTAWLAAAVVP